MVAEDRSAGARCEGSDQVRELRRVLRTRLDLEAIRWTVLPPLAHATSPGPTDPAALMSGLEAVGAGCAQTGQTPTKRRSRACEATRYLPFTSFEW